MGLDGAARLKIVSWNMAKSPAAWSALLTKMDHVVLTRVDPGSMTKITRGAAALAA
jgi:hypothetical protein